MNTLNKITIIAAILALSFPAMPVPVLLAQDGAAPVAPQVPQEPAVMPQVPVPPAPQESTTPQPLTPALVPSNQPADSVTPPSTLTKPTEPADAKQPPQQSSQVIAPADWIVQSGGDAITYFVRTMIDQNQTVTDTVYITFDANGAPITIQGIDLPEGVANVIGASSTSDGQMTVRLVDSNGQQIGDNLTVQADRDVRENVQGSAFVPAGQSTGPGRQTGPTNTQGGVVIGAPFVAGDGHEYTILAMPDGTQVTISCLPGYSYDSSRGFCKRRKPIEVEVENRSN